MNCTIALLFMVLLYTGTRATATKHTDMNKAINAVRKTKGGTVPPSPTKKSRKGQGAGPHTEACHHRSHHLCHS
jgi:hypothetical protein